ncbi:MAG: DUF3301 domain-containing protein [Betaproteobacteria bacterium]|jgi:hypothetical protein
MEWLALLAAVAVGWFWVDTLNAREAALAAGERACAAEGLQFLDWTVAQDRVRIRRDDDGRLRLQRVYRFEYSDTGNNRLEGAVTLLGSSVVALHLAERVMEEGKVIPLR